MSKELDNGLRRRLGFVVIETNPFTVRREAKKGHHILFGDASNQEEFLDKAAKILGIDRDVFKSGHASLRISNFDRAPKKTAGIEQEVSVHPYRCYRLRCWVKAENLNPTDPFGSENFTLEVRGVSDGRRLQYLNPGVRPSSDWQEVAVGFNTWGYDKVRIAPTVEGSGEGKFWIDDLRLEEVGLVNVLRRPGAPFRNTSPVREIAMFRIEGGADSAVAAFGSCTGIERFTIADAVTMKTMRRVRQTSTIGVMFTPEMRSPSSPPPYEAAISLPRRAVVAQVRQVRHELAHERLGVLRPRRDVGAERVVGDDGRDRDRDAEPGRHERLADRRHDGRVPGRLRGAELPEHVVAPGERPRHLGLSVRVVDQQAPLVGVPVGAKDLQRLRGHGLRIIACFRRQAQRSCVLAWRAGRCMVSEAQYPRNDRNTEALASR